MRFLLDTQVILWSAVAPERLDGVAAAFEDASNDLLFSAASAWEMAIKYALGKLPLPDVPARYVPQVQTALRAVPVPIDHAHAVAAGALPLHHRDPFDRMLVAQARLLDVPIVTSDTALAAYDVETLLVA